MRIIPKCLFCVLIFFSLNLHAQQKPAVNLFFEKVYLHTDRDVYMQNDTIWFKAYLVNAQTHAPIGTSGNLYVELIARDSAKLVNREIIRLDYGKGNGDFLLPDSIPSGKYTLRAYTNWMRNFGYNFVFEKSITIYNTEVKSVSAIADSKLKTPVNKNTIAGNAPPGRITQPVSVHFYPEGGSLVEGLNALVAVKAEDAQGRGAALKGAIINTVGDTISRFSCDSLGMGMLSLLPLAGQQYRASFNYKNSNYASILPQALTKGLAMRISNSDSLLTVLITGSDTSSSLLTLMGRHGGVRYFNQSFAFTKGQGLLRIAKNLFPEGIAAITLYDEQNKPNCERLVYIHHQNNPTLTITTDKPVYQPKGKTTVKLKLSDTTQRANLSVAVVDESIVPAQSENIASYLLLTSEIKGNIEHPERYFDTTNVNRFKQLDLLLMTQGWRDFLWRRLTELPIHIGSEAENGIDITGTVKNEKNDKPLPGLNITLYASAAKGTKLFSDRTDSTGRFSFRGLQYYGDHPVKLSASNVKGDKAGTFFMDTLSALPVQQSMLLNVGDTVTTAIIGSLKKQEAQKGVDFKGNNRLKEVKITAKRTVFLGDGDPYTIWGPDQVFDISPKDYQYKTLEWWVLHNVKGAQPGRPQDPLAPPVTGVVFMGIDVSNYTPPGTNVVISRGSPVVIPPELFINGRELYPEDDIEAEVYRSTYYPLSIDKFKRIVMRHVVGISPKYPAIMVDRYLLYLTIDESALAGYNLGSLRPEVNGYYNARTFYKPLYDTPKDLNKPDYRTTIHWEPNITTDAKGEATVSFYNADPKTTVRIVAEGITAKGVPVANVVTYEVK